MMAAISVTSIEKEKKHAQKMFVLLMKEVSVCSNKKPLRKRSTLPRFRSGIEKTKTWAKRNSEKLHHQKHSFQKNQAKETFRAIWTD